MKLIVGLGNPGEKYTTTRHNLGFMVMDQFLRDFEPAENTNWSHEDKVKSQIVHIDWQPKNAPVEKVILAKPETFMNNSGMAVSLIAQYYKIELEDIWVVHDELDLPFGHMKIRFGGAAAGHHGVESIINSLDNDKFWRFRLGIGVSRNKDEMGNHMMHNVDDYVLGSFNQEETGRLRELISHANKTLQFSLEHGLHAAMNKYNSK